MAFCFSAVLGFWLTLVNDGSLARGMDVDAVPIGLSVDDVAKESDPIQGDGVKLLHVISPFRVEDCTSQFCPYDQAQSVTIGSMLRAKERFVQQRRRGGSVTLASAALEGEKLEVNGFDTLPPLVRSTTTQYSHLPSRPSLPFFQDIFDRALQHDGEAEYLIYTNSDIILHNDFYDTVQGIITEQGLDFFTINRRLVSKTRSDGTLRTEADLPEIFNSAYHDHPGSDCFVINRDVAEKINMGDVFIGAPFFANVLNLKSIHHSTKSAVFKSSELMATFHLGDDRNWLNRRMSLFSFQNAMNGVCQDTWLQDVCASSEAGELDQGVRLHCMRLTSKMIRFVDDQFNFDDRNNFCRRQEVELPGKKRVKFIFSMGVEGSGHHFLAAVESHWNYLTDSKDDAGFQALRETQKKAAYNLREIYHLTGLYSNPDSHNLDVVYKEFVTMLKDMQDIVQSIADNDGTSDRVIPVHLNTIDSIMTSFPGTDSVARYSQVPDLGILYRACDDAGVDCGHILMTRDAREVVRSTTRNRSFDLPKPQIVNLSMQLNMMVSQALQYPEKLVGCFDYNNPTSLLESRLLKEWFGTSFESKILPLYKPTASLTLKERNELVPDGFGVYMESMSHAMETLRNTCRKQLSDRASPPRATQQDKKKLIQPFKIVQIGEPRTGSTFQYELLRAMIALKSPQDTKIESKFVRRKEWARNPFQGGMNLISNSTFIIKTHTSDVLLRRASSNNSVATFSSSEIVPYSLYTQRRENLEKCNECEIENYRSFFDLTNDDIDVLKRHMQDFKILRQW